MLVYFALGNAKFWRWVHCPTPTPDARYFAFWWNIGLKKKKVLVGPFQSGGQQKNKFVFKGGLISWYADRELTFLAQDLDDLVHEGLVEALPTVYQVLYVQTVVDLSELCKD